MANFTEAPQGEAAAAAHGRLVEEHRAARDRDLAAPTSRVHRFLADAGHGPEYFAFDPAYRVRARLDPPLAGALTHIERTTGEEEDLPLVGVLRGALHGHAFALTAARTADGEINVAFRDGTSGDESYGFRYLPVEENADGDWWLDFNLAQNPLCAYGDGFRCILPPPGNSLDIAVRAGERRFH